MIKISMENNLIQLNAQDAKELIKRMPMTEKIKLFRELKEENWVRRIDRIRINIDKRRRARKISLQEIHQEIEKARDEFYAHHH